MSSWSGCTGRLAEIAGPLCRQRRLRWPAVLVAVAVLAASCGSSPSTHAATTTTVVVPLPTGPALTAGNPQVAYVSLQNSSAVDEISLASSRVVRSIPVGQSPDDMAITGDNRVVLVANFGFKTPGETVSFIDSSTAKVIDTVNVGGRPAGIAITPDGRTAWICDDLNGYLIPIDLQTLNVGHRIHVGGHPRRSSSPTTVAPPTSSTPGSS